jgi:CRP-like cAMP-binding protein
MATNSSLSTKPSSKPLPSDGEGNQIHNKILVDLPTKERETLFSKVEFVRFEARHVLHEPGDTLKSAYFCDSGLISILSVFSDGKGVEVGLVGKDGFIGIPLVAGFRTASTRAVAQIDATAFRIDSERLARILPECPQLERRLQQFLQVMAMEVTQIAACNRLHEVDEGLARWLLMSTDRIGSSFLAVTPEAGGRRIAKDVLRSIANRTPGLQNPLGQFDFIKFENRVLIQHLP